MDQTTHNRRSANSSLRRVIARVGKLLVAALSLLMVEQAYGIYHYSPLRYLGSRPNDLIQCRDGGFYGTSQLGGTGGAGLNPEGFVFKLNSSGSSIQIIRTFYTGWSSDGYANAIYPYHLIEGKDGYFYGACQSGGSNLWGTIFRMRKDGTAFTNLFAPAYPFTLCIQGDDNFLYGTASLPDTGFAIFRLSTDGRQFQFVSTNMPGPVYGGGISALFNPQGIIISGNTIFWVGPSGDWPSSGLFCINLDGSDFRILHEFDYVTLGEYGALNLSEGPDGRLYGTIYGQDHLDLYAVAKDGSGFEVIRSGLRYRDVIFDNDGWIYNGANDPDDGFLPKFCRFKSDGTMLQVLSSNAPAVLYNEKLVRGQDGAFYGLVEDPWDGLFFRFKEFTSQDIHRLHTGDWLFQNGSGQLVSWCMNLTTDPHNPASSKPVFEKLGSTAVGNLRKNPGSRFLGLEQLDERGNSAIFWQEGTFGAISASVIRGSNVVARIPLTRTSPWLNERQPCMVALDDFDGDGFGDLIGQNGDGTISVWLMKGLSVVKRERFIKSRLPRGWRLLGSASLSSADQFVATAGKGDLELFTQWSYWWNPYTYFAPFPRVVDFANFQRRATDVVLYEWKGKIGFQGVFTFNGTLQYFDDGLQLPQDWRWLGVVK